MDGNYFGLVAQLAEIKLKLAHIGLSICDKPTPRNDIAIELEEAIKLFEDLEDTLRE
ncbi:hypothetical protein LS684_21300 (plasmid) [Cytobacillus spongiae]|uniref:hypothetical protein n=1 Tax=Cytobacillus spongiae TaxID=2901381 RepID=UPI001F4326D3|nr:hypothetical protein [Cytobacillus spongiae]UII58159.1 hypothetical protein LS684_21300 [Cytobacillus spongiae]